MRQNTDHPDLQQFRDMFVVLSAENTKLEARSSTFEDCRSRITTHLRQILDWPKADLTRTWIDVGVEDTASRNSHTFLWRKRCLEAWTESLKHRDSHPLISSELFNFNLTEQAGSGRVRLARAHPLRKRGILYAQRYNINKDIFSTASKRDHGLFGESHREGIACPSSLLDAWIVASRQSKASGFATSTEYVDPLGCKPRNPRARGACRLPVRHFEAHLHQRPHAALARGIYFVALRARLCRVTLALGILSCEADAISGFALRSRLDSASG